MTCQLIDLHVQLILCAHGVRQPILACTLRQICFIVQPEVGIYSLKSSPQFSKKYLLLSMLSWGKVRKPRTGFWEESKSAQILSPDKAHSVLLRTPQSFRLPIKQGINSYQISAFQCDKVFTLLEGVGDLKTSSGSPAFRLESVDGNKVVQLINPWVLSLLSKPN